MKCGEKIARLRKQNNMTQAELGDALSVTYQAVSKWERSESLPDFDTISRIAKLFQVPISYFEEGGEEQVGSDTYSPERETTDTQDSQDTQAMPDIIGMCVRCGKLLREGEADTSQPIMICNSCVEKERQAKEQLIIDQENKKLAEKQARQREIDAEKNVLKRKRNIALLVSIIPAVALIITFLVLAIKDKQSFGTTFGFGCILAVFAYTFTSQMIWDGTVREVCTCGGHIIDLPGIIFSFSPEGILFLIISKIVLFFVAIIVFVGSILFCIIGAILMSPFTFIPSLLWHNHEISKIGK